MAAALWPPIYLSSVTLVRKSSTLKLRKPLAGKGTKPHNILLQRLKRLSRSLSSRTKGSKNRDKAKRKLTKLHARIKNIRQNCLHQLTTRLAENHHIRRRTEKPTV